MKRFSTHRIGRLLPHAAAPLAAGVLTVGCVAHSEPETVREPEPRALRAGEVVIAADDATPRPPFEFDPADERFLDEIQRASFRFFWTQCDPETGLTYDRTSNDTVTIAGVGFGLSALPIAVERGWISRDEGATRAALVLRSLLDEPTNRKAGLYYHFLNPDGSPRRVGTELVVSTIDSAILLSGAVTARSYFGGEVAELAGRMLDEADWSFFQNEDGFLSLGWKPTDDSDPTGDGALLPYTWLDSGDEHRLSTLLAVCAPNEAHRVDPSVYYRLRRQLGRHDQMGEVVWFPYSGALFTAFFAHCWVDHARLAERLGPDDPSAWGVAHRARVDWWENSRRLVHLHRDRAIANPEDLPTFGENAWGLSACDGPDGYLVPGYFPEPVRMIGAEPGADFSTFEPTERWGGGVVPPYAAGSSIVFEPGLALAALRHYRSLEGPDGEPVAWRDPAEGGFGFVDSFRLGDEPWVAEDGVAIDHGPMLLLIENARTGLVWDLFMKDPAVRAGMARLGRTEAGADGPGRP